MTRLVGELGVTDIVDLRSETEMHLTGPARCGRSSRSPITTTPSWRRVRPMTWRVRWPRPLVVHLQHPARGMRTTGPALPDLSRSARPGHRRRPSRSSRALGAPPSHCAAGKDRTGTVVALALDVAGVPHDVIADDYALTALRLPAIIERLMAHDFYGDTLATQRPSDQIPMPRPCWPSLADLGERHSGTRAWLRSRWVVRGRRRAVARPAGRLTCGTAPG